MSNEDQNNETLSEEFRTLGKNLIAVIQAAWDHPERKRMQQEIESGLHELGNALKQEAENIADSQTAQQLKIEFEELGERIKSGERQAEFRQELLSAIKVANAELQKAIQRISVQSTKHTDEKENNS